MRFTRDVLAIAFALIVLPIGVATVSAVAPSRPQRVDPSQFHPVSVPVPLSDSVEPTASPTHIAVIYDSVPRRPEPQARPTHKPVVAKVKVKTVTVKPPKQPKAPSQPRVGSSRSVRGLATWYCKAGRSVCHRSYPDRRGVTDLYAAAGGEIRIGHWRGRTVRVCRTDGLKCVKVKLVDWCACGGNRIIDLYWDAFNVLNVRGETGGLKVRVSW